MANAGLHLICANKELNANTIWMGKQFNDRIELEIEKIVTRLANATIGVFPLFLLTWRTGEQMKCDTIASKIERN